MAQNKIRWKLVVFMALLTLIIAAVGLFLGLFLEITLFPGPRSGADGWLMYFLPINMVGGLVVGVIEAIVLSLKLKRQWVSLIAISLIASAANAYFQVWIVGIITYILNILFLFYMKKVFYGSRLQKNDFK